MTMKHVITVVLAVMALSGVVFGLYEKSRVSELEAEKEALVEQVEEQRQQAVQFQKMAAVAQEQALVQRTICEEQLRDCKPR